MTKNSTLIVLVFMIVFVAGFWWLLKPEASTTETSIVTPELSESEEVSTINFISPQTGERASVDFTADKAILNGAGYEGVLMSRVESASGAKYSDGQDNISVWNKGEELTVYVGEEVVFVGQTESSGVPDASSDVTDSEIDIYGTWNWLNTQLADGTVITPEQPGVFSSTLTENGELSATTDCNSVSGQFSREESSINVGPLAMTMMFCEESKETEFTAPLNGTLSTSVNDGNFSLISSSGDIMNFTPN